MASRNTRQTGSKAASAASKVLSSPKAGNAAKTAAASALSQTPKRGKKCASSIKLGVRYALWAKTAGRCTSCSRRVLNDTRTFWHSIGAAG
jgi:hypothetical protein